MKFTLAEVLDAYIVLHDTSGLTVSYSLYDDDKDGLEASISWECDGLEFTFIGDGNQPVRVDGDYFYATDSDGAEECFRAYTLVRLGDIPEI